MLSWLLLVSLAHACMTPSMLCGWKSFDWPGMQSPKLCGESTGAAWDAVCVQLYTRPVAWSTHMRHVRACDTSLTVIAHVLHETPM